MLTTTSLLIMIQLSASRLQYISPEPKLFEVLALGSPRPYSGAYRAYNLD
jgi:hypothetical protein